MQLTLFSILLCHVTWSNQPDRTRPTVAYRGARVLTAAGAVFEPGSLIVRDGKIIDVGPAATVPVPDGAVIRELGGKVIIPGLVDTHSHIGVYSRPAAPANSDGNEMTGPVQSAIRALDAVNPDDPGIRMAVAGGITCANIMPGSGNVIGGQTIYVKLRGRTIDEMRVVPKDVLGGLKMANGENPKRSYGGKGQAPATRMKLAALQRAEFVRARDYQRKWDAHRQKLAEKKDDVPPAVDLGLEPLVEVLQRKRTVHFHSHRADDILTAVRLAEEFGFELVIQHGTEGYKVAEELARRKVPVSMTVVDSPGGKAEVVDFLEECGARMAAAGVKVLVNTDDFITESRFFLRTAAIAVRGGMTEELALKAVTLHPAQVLHLDHRLGSLEKGKDADLVILSGPPFSVYTRVLETYIDGRKEFDLADASSRRYQTGGFAVSDSRLPDAKRSLDPVKAPSAPAVPRDRLAPNSSSKTCAILVGRIHTVSKGSIDNGAILIEGGKIIFVGPRNQLNLRPDLPVLTAAAVTPGLIDAHATVPLSGEYNIAADQDADEKTDPNQADLRVLDAFNPREPLLRFLLAQGITVAHVCPGRANVIAGQTGVFRTHGHTAESMVVRFPQALLINLGLAPKEAYPGKRPGTRMGTAALVRTALTEAADYQRKAASAKADKDRPERNLRHEAIGLALDRKLPAFLCAQRADDIVTAMRIASEFKLRGMLGLGGEAYLVAPEIAGAGLPVIVHPTMQRIGDLETINSFLGNAAALVDQRIRVAIGGGLENYVPKTRVVRHEAAIAMVHGLGFESALRSITLDAARILDIDDRFGSIEAGKVADLVLYDGDPFEHATHVSHVLIDGRVAYERAEEQKISFARRAMFAAPEVPCCLGW